MTTPVGLGRGHLLCELVLENYAANVFGASFLSAALASR